MAKKKEKKYSFEDLKFETHHIDSNASRAVLNFNNNYGISIISGDDFLTTPEFPFEIGILKFGEITDEIIGYCDIQTINEQIKNIQNLPDAKKEDDEIAKE